jgi:DNA-binding NarL/FixJ family response regulator
VTVCGYLLKDADPDELLAGIRAAALPERRS